MKILKLRKIKLGNNYSVVRVTYRSFFATKERDCFQDKYRRWVWYDTCDLLGSWEEAVQNFFNSDELEYTPNTMNR